MLEELGKDLWNVALAGIGAVAIASEKAYELGKVCVEKGGETLEKGKAVSEDLMRKGEQIAQERREKYRQEALERLTAVEREELRIKLADLDAKEAAEKAAQAEADRMAAEIDAEEKKVIDFEPKDDHFEE